VLAEIVSRFETAAFVDVAFGVIEVVEPSTMALFGLGLAAATRLRRQRAA
jgi:hypothetical protein